MPDAKFPTEDEDSGEEIPMLSARTRALDPSTHDALLEKRIWEQIHAARELDARDLSIVVRNRSATLFGSAVDDAQRAEFERIALRISGIVEVTNRLKVAAPAH